MTMSWSFNDRTEIGTKHFRGLSTDADLTNEQALELSNEPLKNGDEAYRLDTGDVQIYDSEHEKWVDG